MEINEIMLEKNVAKNPAIELLKKMGYKYLSPAECNSQRYGKYNCVLKDVLKEQLKIINSFEYCDKQYNFSNYNIDKAVSDIDIPLASGLVKTSEKIYNLLMLGESYVEKINDKNLSFGIKYIDWENPENNVFHITEEFVVERVDGKGVLIPDCVLFVNGIPFSVIEFKAPTERVEEGIEQNIRNQYSEAIPQLYKFVSMVFASNKNEVKYGTTATPKNFFSTWNYERDEKDEIDNYINSLNLDRVSTYQDKIFASMLQKNRLLDITKYFILFDKNVKKVCRYQQYYGVKNVIKTISQFEDNGNRKSGVVWHTQGSGKSLTMVMIANYILNNINKGKSKIIIVTDRKELDKQIAQTFSHTKLKPSRATSGGHLVKLINKNKADVITTIINKFSKAENEKVKNLSNDIFILVDESHRSNYNLLATKMRMVFPNASYIGFTGTPLMKKEKNTALTFGGNMIHKYTIQNGVDDKTIVPLIYEGRFVEQKVDEENIDLWFNKTCKKLNLKQQDDLSRKWSSIKKLNSTDKRIERIALDIDEHFVNNFKDTGFKAMLATNFKKDAVKYYNTFKNFSDLKVAVCISSPNTREGYDNVDESDIPEVVKFWKEMIDKYNSPEDYEDSIKNKFLDGDIDILIVCSKLLTGFDAPLCQVLYIDKQLKEHGLLQAIARTNRLYEGKDFGLIVDYRGLIDKIDDALELYSGNGLENYDSQDLKGVITDVLTAVSELRQAYTYIESIFVDVKNKQDEEEFELYLEQKGEEKRVEFYNCLCEFGKKLSLVLCSNNAYSAINDNDPKEIKKYKDKFLFYSKLRISIKKRCAETLDNKEYEREMTNLLNKHISVTGLKQITNQINILKKGDLEREIEELINNRAKADSIRYNISKNINIKYEENPAYYDCFSKRIKETLELYKAKVIIDIEYLERMKNILDDFRTGNSGIFYPSCVKDNVQAQAFYGVILPIINDKNDYDVDLIGEIALNISKIIHKWAKVDFSNNLEIHNRIEQDIDDLFFEYSKNDKITLSYDEIDKVIENVKSIAIRCN
ncbi:MAG: type I restriction endonuclease subunit R [Clostridia bacterium]|nr:type I restriction endonuclease subunit R [Clostridia bacterium]